MQVQKKPRWNTGQYRAQQRRQQADVMLSMQWYVPVFHHIVHVKIVIIIYNVNKRIIIILFLTTRAQKTAMFRRRHFLFTRTGRFKLTSPNHLWHDGSDLTYGFMGYIGLLTCQPMVGCLQCWARAMTGCLLLSGQVVFQHCTSIHLAVILAIHIKMW